LFSIWHITDTFYLPVWLSVVSASLSLSVVWVYLKAVDREMDTKSALDMSLALLIGSFLGARILHVLFEAPEVYRADPTAVFRIWEGGMVFYGGLAGGLIAAAGLVFWRKLSWRIWADFYAPIIAANYAVGRLACFLNGCCYGKVCELPWAMKFPSHAHWGMTVLPRHPAQLYASAWEFAVLIFVLWLDRKRVLQSGNLAMTWLLFHSVGRLMMEHFRDDDRGAQLAGLSLSSWLSLGLFCVSLICLILTRRSSVRV